MNILILYSGYFLVALGIAVLAVLIMQAMQMKNNTPEERKNKSSRLIILNFAGLGLAVIGLMLIVISSFF